jgi:branched-chain amino acid transport system ATP-binding protein
MLSLVNVQVAYGSSRVLFDVNVEVPHGKIVTLLGRNGMGKTTTVRAIMGLVANRRGIVFDGASIDAATPEAIARRGVGLVPEGRMVFPTLTVRENLIAIAAQRGGRDYWTQRRI